MKVNTILFVLISWLVACNNSQPTNQSTTNNVLFVGTWKLHSRIDIDSNQSVLNEPTLGSDPISILMYDKLGNMSVQIMKRNRNDSVISPQEKISNNSQAFNGYDAYFGTYEIDSTEQQITHAIQGSINPEDVGKKLKRNFILKGDTLRLSFSTVNSGVPVKRTLTFIRQNSR